MRTLTLGATWPPCAAPPSSRPRPVGARPHGTVAFKDDATVLATVPLTGGWATLTTSTLGVGTHTITAVYSGSVAFVPAASPGLTQTVAPADTTAAYGDPVTFTAVVRMAAPGLGVPAGSVTFTRDGSTLGTVLLNAQGWATSTAFPLPVGSTAIVARYSGDGSAAASTSNTVTQRVSPAKTTTAIMASTNPSTVGQSVTFTAGVVAATPGATPTGTVTFRDGATVLGTAALGANGTASVTTAALSAGIHRIVAEYSGDATSAASTSPALLHQVIRP